MTLKERIIKECKHRDIKKELESVRDEKSDKINDVFFGLCEHLRDNVDLHDVDCSTYAKIFQAIEDKHIDISKIIKPYDYQTFKKEMLMEPIQLPMDIGKKPDKIYDLRNEDDYIEYMEKWERERNRNENRIESYKKTK